MEEITIVLLEDDPIDQIKMEIMLAEQISSRYTYRLISPFTQLEDLLRYLHNHKVDLILSDIMIENKPVGIELLKILRDTLIPIVLMTSSQDPKLFSEAQRYRNVHYLIKPFHAISLQATLEKTIEEYRKSKQYDFLDGKYLYLSSKMGQREQVWLTDIVYIEAEDSYCYIYTLTKKYVLKKSLNKLLSEDLDERFIRIHHKYAVNKAGIRKAESDTIQLTEQVELPVGKSFKKDLNSLLK
jgi:DNA-binding LytR/AlgR family response regulator